MRELLERTRGASWHALVPRHPQVPATPLSQA